MASLTDALRGAISPELLDQLNAMILANEDGNQSETVTAGALSVKGHSDISVTGTVAYTLADGEYIGQVKTLNVTVAASTPDGTLTPATFVNATSIDLDAVNESLALVWTAAGWVVTSIVGATLTP